MSSRVPPVCPSPYPPGVENLTGVELARLAANEKCREAVRTEVCRRLQDSPDKANFLTFRWLTYRWLVPADEADGAGAYNGLIGCCWNATKKRLPYGLFRRGRPETYCEAIYRRDGSVARRAGGAGEETREAIMDALVERLYELKGLPHGEIILTALNGEFQTDADVGNALRRKVGVRSRYLFQYGGDFVGKADDWVTLLDVLKENPAGPQPNPYSDTVELILQEKSQVVEELGEEGWEVIEEIVNLADNDSFSQTKPRERQRLVTEVFQTAYGVNPRQARTHKSRFLAAVEAGASEGKPAFEEMAKLLDWLGCWDDEKS